MGLMDNMGLKGYAVDMNAPYYTQEYVPVKNVINGIIETKDGRYIKILEVLPLNLNSRSNKERDVVAYNFSKWLSIAPVNLQIKIVTEQSDPEKMINRLKRRYEQDKDFDVKNHIKHYSELLKQIGGIGAIEKKYYLIISYEPNESSPTNPSIYEIVDSLNTSVNTITAYFEDIGNTVMQIEYDDLDENFSIVNFLYKLYNPRTSANEIGKPARTLRDRVQRVNADTALITQNPQAVAEIDSIIAPTGIDFTHPDCVIMDGLYYSFILISGDSYPINVPVGWYSDYFSLAEGETVDMFIHKENKAKLATKLSGKIKDTNVKLFSKNETHSDYEKTANALQAAMYIKEQINSSGENMFHMATLLTITDTEYKTLMRRKAQIIEAYQSIDVYADPLINLQEEAFKSHLPFINLSPKLYDKGKRNILTSGLSSSYPFSGADMKDEGGMLLGLDTANNTICVINPFLRKLYKNANMVILGTSGAGKTYLEQLLALRSRSQGTRCFFLVPEKSHEFQRAAVNGVRGEFIRIASSSSDHINIMDIRPTTSEVIDILQGESAEKTIWVVDKAQSIITFISLMIPDLQNDEEQILDSCIMNVYRRYGITEDNDSIYLDPNDKSKGLKEMPILGDLYKELQSSNISPRILNIFTQFTTGSARSFNARTNVNLDNKYIVFDISGLQGRLLPAGMFLVLDFLVGRIKEDVTERDMVFIDEGWRLIGSGANPKAAEYVKWLFKIIRGYNGSACIATQDIGDFFALNDGEYGKAILHNAQIKFILNLTGDECDMVKDELKLNDNEVMQIINFKTGQCLVCANSNHIAVDIKGCEYEDKLITTDPEKVAIVVQELKKTGGILE